MNYHTSFHPSMQNDNGWTMSGHQVVCCVPQIDRRGLLNGLKPVRKEFAFVLMSLEGVSRVSPPASNTLCTTDRFVRTLWNSVLLKVPRVHRAGSDSKQRCRKTMLLKKQEAQLWGAAESHFTRCWSERQRRAGFLMQ